MMDNRKLLKIVEDSKATRKQLNASSASRVSATGSAAGSAAGSPSESRRSSVSAPGVFPSKVPVHGPAAGSTSAPFTVLAVGSGNDSKFSPVSVSEVKPVAYSDLAAPYPMLKVDLNMGGVRGSLPVQKIVASVSGTSNVAGDVGLSPAASGVIADNRDHELKVVHAQLRERFEALEVELSTEKKKNEDWRVFNEESQEKNAIVVARYVSLETAFRGVQEDAANYKKSTESLSNRLYETQAMLDIVQGERESLVNKLEKREGEIYELQQALQMASSSSTSSPGLSIDANEYQLLKDENTALKAQLSDKDKRIAELERVQGKASFLVIPCNEGVNEGVMVTTGSGCYTMHAQQVQVSFNAGVGGKNDTIASETNSEASVDPGTVNWILTKIDTDEFVTAVIEKLTDIDLIPGVFVKKLQTVEGFSDVVRLLLKDLRLHDQAEFPRGGKDDVELVESFVRDIKNIHMNPVDYDDDNYHAFREHGFNAVEDLSFIPGSTPTVNRVAFKDTEMDAELEKYTMKFHDTHVNQYLNWDTETSKKIRAFIMDESASETGSGDREPPSISSSNSPDGSIDPEDIHPSDVSSDAQANPPARSFWAKFAWGRGVEKP